MTRPLWDEMGSRARLTVGALLSAFLVLSSSVAIAGDEVLGRIVVRPELEAALANTAPDEGLVVLVTGKTEQHAVSATEAAGLKPLEVFDRLGIVAAVGPADAIRAVHHEPGVLRVDANQPLELLDDVAHGATGLAALRDPDEYPELRRLRRLDRTPYDGSGVSIAVVDLGFATSHEQFVDEGESKFDVHLRQACPPPREFVHYYAGADPTPDCAAWAPVPTGDDDSGHAGHGTIVAGVAAGFPRRTPSGAGFSGVAPGARLIGLSTGSAPALYNIVSALNWVLEHHEDPCGDGSCPPIRVVNNSYGLRADDDFASRRFDPDAPMSRATSELIEDGVVVVFAAGNDGGDGSSVTLSHFALHPVPGMLGVGMYSDADVGDREVAVNDDSSRGKIGDPSTYPDLVAPGVQILAGCVPSQFCPASPGVDGAYSSFTGTSLAAPYVAGVVALLLEADPSLTPAEVEDVVEDSAYRFFPSDRLEADTFQDPAGNIRGNDDHATTFDAGHGLIDVVAALGSLKPGRARPAPAVCPAHEPVIGLTDPAGDTRLHWYAPVPVEMPGHDIVSVTASLQAVASALTVTVAYADLPETSPRMRTTIHAVIDRREAVVDFERSPAGDSFTLFSGQGDIEGIVDPDADTVTFVLSPVDGSTPERASVTWVYTANGPGEAEVDQVSGLCSVSV